MAKMGLTPPWIEYYNELEVMFKEDPEVKVLYYEDDYKVKLFVDNDKKATALSMLIPEKKVFGNIVMSIEIVPANGKLSSVAATYRDAFENNRVVSDIREIEFFGTTYTYVVFVPEVVQYWTDNISDLHGLRSTLYQDVAKDLFDCSNVFFCTDLAAVEEFGMPLGEWP